MNDPKEDVVRLTEEMVLRVYDVCRSNDRQTGVGNVEVRSLSGAQGVEYFNRTALESRSEVIMAMLSQLPEDFKRREGASAWRAEQLENGVKWTNGPLIAQRLLLMGIAIEAVERLDEGRARFAA